MATVSLALALAGCGGGSAGEGREAAATGQPGASSAPPARERATALAAPGQARWGNLIPLSIVPAAAANLPDGKVLLWSAESRFTFYAFSGQTYTTVLDPATGTATERLVNETGHDMFCPGTTNLPDGRLLVNGGINSALTSLYDPATGRWSRSQTMGIPRGYQSNTLLADGTVFTLGGSWSGEIGGKHAEVWTEGSGWRRLAGVPIDPMMGPDPRGAYRGDNHLWLFTTGWGQVLHAGPSNAMVWIDTRGNGSTRSAGARADDPFSINGNAVMVDPDTVITIGGAPAYDGGDATRNVHRIDLSRGPDPTVTALPSMAYARAFHNSVVLPNGQVLVLGGQTRAVPFSDDRSVLVPELFDPATNTWSPLPPMAAPRNYHSVALLLPDARVLSSGGGLCGVGCSANHADAQILTPHYLLDSQGNPASRPSIQAAPDRVAHGAAMTVRTDRAVTAFALVRMASTTHTVNTDQRRLPLSFRSTGTNTYGVDVPTNTGAALPGLYMLFALDAQGVPSVARLVRLGVDGQPRLTWPGHAQGQVGVAASLAPAATSPDGTGLVWSATNLPPGLTIDASTGAIRGTPTAAGVWRVNLSVRNNSGRVSTDLAWTVAPGAGGSSASVMRHVMLEQVSEINGRAWASMAELNLLNGSGAPISRSGWSVEADSEEPGEGPALAIDGANGSFWHTRWSGGTAPPPPHRYIVHLAQPTDLGGLRVLPRQDASSNGTIAQYRLYGSADGVHWGTPLASGTLFTAATAKQLASIAYGQPLVVLKPELTVPSPATTTVGTVVSLPVQAASPQGDALTYLASNLPPGLTIAAATGRISGSPTTAGRWTVTLTVRNTRGATASGSFAWVVQPGLAGPAVASLRADPIVAGNTATWAADADGGGALQYAWDAGDGSAASAFRTDPTFSHAYAAPGLYTVTLRVRDAAGNVTTKQFLQAVTSAPAAGAAPRSSSAIVLEPRSGTRPRLWVANADQGTVGVIDTAMMSRVAEVNVGGRPTTLALSRDGEVWVVDAENALLRVISTSTLGVVRTIALARASRPFGVVLTANGTAYVTLEATGTLLKVGANGTLLGSVPVGPNPRDLALTGNGQKAYVSRFITPPLPGEGTANVRFEANGTPRGGEVVVVQTSTMSVAGTAVLRHSTRDDSTVQGRGVPNYLGAPVIAPDGRAAWIPSKQDNIARGVRRDGLPLNFQNTVRAVSSRLDLATLQENPAERVDHDNASLASAAVFHPSGAYLFVALETSRELAVVDPVGRREVMRVPVGRAPQGVAISGDGRRVYVYNFMGRSVSSFDVTPLVQNGEARFVTLPEVASTGTEVLSAQVLRGKQLFYDAADTRLARDGYMSCATCHRDGGHDGRTWDLTGFGEGLRNTIALRGRAGMAQGRLHWSANFDEVQDFEGQIRNLAGGSGLLTDAQFNGGTRSQPLGDRKAGLNADLDALAAYVASLDRFDASPWRAADGSLTAAGAAGRQVFANRCASCHGGANYTASASGATFDIGTLKPTSGQRLGGTLTALDPPTLRDVWATAPYLHDGSAATLGDAVRAHADLGASSAEVDSVVAFLQQVGREEPGIAAPGGATNVARGVATSQSSTDFGGVPARAVDGNTNGVYGNQSVTHTRSESRPWWQADLGRSRSIDSITLWNRSDCCAERLQNFVVFVSATDMTGRSLDALLADAAVWKVSVANTVQGSRALTVNATGRYVRVQLRGTNPLSLAEVQVIGR